MDSTSLRRAACRLAATLGLVAAFPAAAFNHDTIVNPLPPGHYPVACSNIRQDTSRIAPGTSASDYWEGREHYIDEILAYPSAAVHFDARVPDDPSVYPGHAGGTVPFAAIVCYPTNTSNTDPDYVLPGSGDVIPHMAQPGNAPRIITACDYAVCFPEMDLPVQLPLIVFSHGLTGSPISSGYVQALVQLAAQGFMVAAPFHGDPRFSRVRVEDLGDVAYILANFDRIVEMQLMRPLSLKAMVDTLLADPGYAIGIDPERIVGFGASLGGEAMMLLMGASLTTSLDQNCRDVAAHDPRIKAAVGYVPFAGWSFLPAFCTGQAGAASVDRPFLAISGTADTTAPISRASQAVSSFQSSRYVVELIGGKHELRPEDAGDLFTWTLTFLDAYVPNPLDPNAMARFIKMDGVVGGRDDDLLVDVHVPSSFTVGDTPVVEFYNPDLGHYFMAAGPSEIEGIEQGIAGNWQLTRQGFKAWLDNPPPGAVPVCRFYGRPAGGPNSHFFTAEASECDLVKSSGGWYYEGIGFYIKPVDANGRCPAGYLEVNRAYNNGFPRNDSNHRFSTSDSTMREMAAQGWVVEGAVMCALP
jgi:fermentation-respiration switch protein FrsA (DUF1100 family)